MSKSIEMPKSVNPYKLIDPEANEEKEEQEPLISNVKEKDNNVKIQDINVHSKFNCFLNICFGLSVIILICCIISLFVIAFVSIFVFQRKCGSNCIKKICFPSITDKLPDREYPCVCHVEDTSISSNEYVCGKIHTSKWQDFSSNLAFSSFIMLITVFCVINCIIAIERNDLKNNII